MTRQVDPLVAALRRRRLQLKLTQREVERLMGYSPNGFLAAYERGRLSPGLPMLRRWIETLGGMPDVVWLDEDGESDTDPQDLPPELLPQAVRSERLTKLAATDMSASEIAKRVGMSERSVHRRREKGRADATQ